MSLFRKPSPDELVQRSLDQHCRSLLEAYHCKDYYTKIVEFHEMRIRSLSTALKRNDPHD